MSRPNLQIALDHNDLEHALGDVMKVGDVVDIIEVGTILCLQEGQKAIRCIRSMFPDKNQSLIRNVQTLEEQWRVMLQKQEQTG